MNQKSLLILILFVLWGYVSWQWYTCGIKGFCIVEHHGEHRYSEKRRIDDRDSKVFIVGETQVVQAQSTHTCPQLLSTHLKIGAVNDIEEVEKLQLFLNNVEQLPTPVTGAFDESTHQRVMEFQSRYAGEILKSRWGLNEPTGFVYQTTQKKINDRYCEHMQGSRGRY